MRTCSRISRTKLILSGAVLFNLASGAQIASAEDCDREANRSGGTAWTSPPWGNMTEQVAEFPFYLLPDPASLEIDQPIAGQPRFDLRYPCDDFSALGGQLVCPAVQQEFHILVSAASGRTITQVEYSLPDAGGAWSDAYRCADYAEDPGECPGYGAEQTWWRLLVDYSLVPGGIDELEIKLRMTDSQGTMSIDSTFVDMCNNPVTDGCTGSGISGLAHEFLFDAIDAKYHMRSIFPDEPMIDEPLNLPAPLSVELDNKVEAYVYTIVTLEDGVWYAQKAGADVEVVLLDRDIFSESYSVDIDVTEGEVGAGCNGLQLVIPGVDIDMFQDDWAWEIFDGTVFSGFIGPVQIDVDVSVDVGLGVDVSGTLSGELQYPDTPHVNIQFDVDPVLSPWLEGSVSVKVFKGIVKATGKLKASADFTVPVTATLSDSGIDLGSTGICFDFLLEYRVEAYVLGKRVADTGWKDLVDPDPVGAGCSAPAPLAPEGERMAAGGGITDLDLLTPKTPAIAISPNGASTLVVYTRNQSASSTDFDSEPMASLDTGSGPALPDSILPPGDNHVQMDTDVSFVTDDQAIAVWTENRLTLADEAVLGGTVADYNMLFRNKDIFYSLWDSTTGWAPPLAAIPDTGSNRRTDGVPRVAGLRDFNAALIAWVRHPNSGNLLDTMGNVKTTELDIFSRTISLVGPPGPPVNVSALFEPTPAMDSEPAIGASETGDVAMLVWVRDEDGEDTTLEDRYLMLAIGTPMTGWLTPAQITDPVAHPGVAMPSIAVHGPGDALIAFTTRQRVRDGGTLPAGEGNKDVVHVLQFRGASFEPVHQFTGQDGQTFNGRHPQVVYLDGEADKAAIVCRQYSGLGRTGGDGEVSIAIGDLRQPPYYWSEMHDLTQDAQRDWEIVAASDRDGRIRLAWDSSAGNAAFDGLKFQSLENLVPDLALESMDIDALATPGVLTNVSVDINNLGLGWPPVGEMLNVRIGSVGPGGSFTELDSTSVLFDNRPDEAQTLSFSIVAPAEYTEIRVIADPLFAEMGVNPLNDQISGFIGVPAPQNLAATTALDGDETHIEFAWDNPASYDSINLYRDGDFYAGLPGFIASNVIRNADTGTSTWGYEGVIEGVSSARVEVDVEVMAGGSCTTIGDCADKDADGIRDDACVFWTCDDGSCFATDVIFADMGGTFGSCAADGSADGNDRFHALNCFANVDPNGAAGYPCEAAPPAAFNVDAVGAFGACAPDGNCDGNDAFAALNAFGDSTTCSCPLDGPAPAPVRTEPPLTASLRLVPSAKQVAPGGLIEVDVYFDQAPADLRGYQLHATAAGGVSGSLELIDMAVHSSPRRVRKATGAHVFDRLGYWSAFNVDTAQMVVGLDAAGIVPEQGGYLATLTYKASGDASGTFVVDLLHDPDEAAHRTFLFATQPGVPTRITAARAAVVRVEPRKISRR